MNRCLTALLVVFVVAGAELRADDPLPSIESLLNRWTQASRDCQSLDAKLRVFQYDLVFNKGPKICEGRYRYEVGGDYRYYIEHSGGWLRRGESLWEINDTEGRCRHYDLRALRDQVAKPSTTSSWFSWFNLFRDFPKLILGVTEQNGFPHLLLPQSTELTEQFDLNVRRSDEGTLILQADSKDADHALCRQIQFAFSKDSSLPFAIRYELSDKNATVVVLNEMRLNEVPPDRDAFMNPDLSKQLVIHMSDSHGN